MKWNETVRTQHQGIFEHQPGNFGYMDRAEDFQCKQSKGNDKKNLFRSYCAGISQYPLRFQLRAFTV